MKKTTFQRLSVILFYGSIWGILEASLGYALHFLPALVSGSIMFPLVTFILLRAYANKKSKSDLLWIGLVAMMIKSINLFMPNITIWKTINPMICIVVESLMVIAVVNLLNKESIAKKIVALPLASIGWNAIYLTYLYITYRTTGTVFSQIASLTALGNYLLFNCLISGILATGIYFIGLMVDKKLTYRFIGKAWLALPAFGMALFLTVIL